MAVTTSSRLGITLWSAGSDAFSRAQMQASHVALEASAAMYSQAVFASRPTAGVAGRVFWATDTEVLYYDTGVAWKLIGSPTVARTDQANTFTANQTITDANIVLGTTTGTKIGTGTNQKLAFFNSTPVVQPTGSILTALSALGLVATPTLASTALSDTANIARLDAANTFTAQQTVPASSGLKFGTTTTVLGASANQFLIGVGGSTDKYVFEPDNTTFYSSNVLLRGAPATLTVRSPNSGAATLDLSTRKNNGTAIHRRVVRGSAYPSPGYVATTRWDLVLGDNTEEPGSNVGSNFLLEAYGDTGTLLTTPISIARATGIVSVNNGLIAPILTNAQSGSDYPLVLADAGKQIEMSYATANTLTVPTNASVAFPVGTQIAVLQTGAGQTTITPAGGVTINGYPGLKLAAQWAGCVLTKRATNTWVVQGGLTV
jgi:hypothetical protein